MHSGNICIGGFMCSGKTSVGRELSRRLGWEFLDTDVVIEQRAGMPVPRIFAELGEPVFRRAEGPAEIWLYSGQRCQLDLILYPAGREMLVAWAAARAAGTGRVTEEACLREVGGRVPGA